MANIIKRSTGLTGLAVSKHPHLTLENVYGKILYALTFIPESASYRKYTQKLVEEKLAIVKNEPIILRLEEKLGGDQVEELIEQAQNELNLVKRMSLWKPWKQLVEDAPRNQWKWPIN